MGHSFFAEPFWVGTCGRAFFNIAKITKQKKLSGEMTFLLEIEEHNDYIALKILRLREAASLKGSFDHEATALLWLFGVIVRVQPK